eukprot:TRINITY_DN12917_c0_g1_i1.p1 TRINITY_DN12917_c0_g1~~TRINITY_DN12917_c0_g1_i1.p1  ORF type:complete len:100 (-),score=4.68 TRINITY_DN12917_c0_g1_i1:152-451(-)
MLHPICYIYNPHLLADKSCQLIFFSSFLPTLGRFGKPLAGASSTSSVTFGHACMLYCRVSSLDAWCTSWLDNLHELFQVAARVLHWDIGEWHLYKISVQ